MHPRNRCYWFLALATVVVVTAACGGQPAEPPAEEAAPAPAEEAAPAAEAAPEPAPMPEEPMEPEEPAAPQLQGSIVDMPEAHEWVWLTAATRETPAKYYWVVRLRNDTTQTLDITVVFQFLNAQESVVKTDRKTLRLAPAATEDFRVEDEMVRDDAIAVENYTYTWEWKIVEGS